MITLRIPEPSEKQKLFFLDRHRYIAFGGARGGGKTWAVRVKAALLCLQYAGIKVMIIRKTYPELNENHIIPLCELLHCNAEDKRARIASYNDAKKHMKFPNGSRIIFRYCENDRDAQRFQGLEVDVLFVDEATQQPEERMKMLTACVRGVNSFPKRVYYTCNPGGEGHGWIKRQFVDREYKDAENGENYGFIQALVTDNKALMRADPDYIKQLDALPPRLREAWRFGRWDVFEGQFFDDFQPDPPQKKAEELGESVEELRKQRRWCHVIEPFDISKGECRGWNLMRSYDWGYNRPFSLAYWAVDYDGVIYRILELYGCTETPNEGVKWTPDEMFARAAELERMHPWLKGRAIREGVADPSIWDASRGESIAETAMRYGLYFTPGDNKRLPGWMQMHYRLQFDAEGYPRMYIFKNCKAFIRTIPQMIYSTTNPEDLDTRLEDHVADETRYMCMSRPVKPMPAKEEEVIVNDPLNQFGR